MYKRAGNSATLSRDGHEYSVQYDRSMALGVFHMQHGTTHIVWVFGCTNVQELLQSPPEIALTLVSNRTVVGNR